MIFRKFLSSRYKVIYVFLIKPECFERQEIFECNFDLFFVSELLLA